MVGQKKKISKKNKKNENDKDKSKKDTPEEEIGQFSKEMMKNISNLSGKLNITGEVIPFEVPNLDSNLEGIEICDDTQNRTMVHVQVTRRGEEENGARNYSGVDTWAVGYENVSGVFDDVVKELKKHDGNETEQAGRSDNHESIFRRRALYERKAVPNETISHFSSDNYQSEDLKDSKQHASSVGFSDDAMQCDTSWEQEKSQNDDSNRKAIESTKGSSSSKLKMKSLFGRSLPGSENKNSSCSREGRFDLESTAVEPQMSNKNVLDKAESPKSSKREKDLQKVTGFSFKMKKVKGFNLRYTPEKGACLLFDGEACEPIKLLEENEKAAIILKLNGDKPVSVRVVKEK